MLVYQRVTLFDTSPNGFHHGLQPGSIPDGLRTGRSPFESGGDARYAATHFDRWCGIGGKRTNRRTSLIVSKRITWILNGHNDNDNNDNNATKDNI